jgi:hypothetical protein
MMMMMMMMRVIVGNLNRPKTRRHCDGDYDNERIEIDPLVSLFLLISIKSPHSLNYSLLGCNSI